MGTEFKRGQVLAATISETLGEKYYLVVSNNLRNRNLDSMLVVRITSRVKNEFPTMIQIPMSEGNLNGWVLCDEIQELYPEEVRQIECSFSRPFMDKVKDGLMEALALA